MAAPNIPRVTSTRPLINAYTPPIPQPAQNGENLLACVVALKAGVESLIGQRGDAANRAVTFHDLVSFGVLTPQAVTSPRGSVDFGGGGGLSEAPIDGFAYGRKDASWSKVLLLTGGSINGNLVVTGTTTLGATTVATPAAADNSTNAATTAWVTSKGYLTSVGAGTIYAPINSPVFTGDPRAPTPSLGDNDTSIVTSAWVNGQGYLTSAGAASVYAPINSPVFTGDPRAPTPAVGDNDTSVATTAFVKSQGYLTGNQSISLTTDVTGSGTTSIASTVVGLRGRPVANIAPTTNQVLSWDGAQWLPATVSGGSGNYVLKTGDVMSGNLTIGPRDWPGFLLQANAGSGAQVIGYRGTSLRWVINLPTSSAESTGNAGSDFTIDRYSDSAAWLGNALVLVRATGNAAFQSNLTLGGQYLSFSGASPSGVNATGGPFIYADTNTMVFKQGSNTNGFWWQNYTGYIVAKITGDTARLQLFQPTSTTNYIEIYNDSNGHINNVGNPLYINWWSQQVTNFGNGIQLYNNGWVAMLGGRTRAYQSGNNNNYIEMFHDGAGRIESTASLSINLNGANATFGGQIWCQNSILCGNECWYYGRTNGNNYYDILGCVGNVTYVGNATWNTYIRASGSIYSSGCHIAPGDNNTKYCGHSGLNWYQVCAYSFYNPSDASLKHDIAEAPTCLDVVRAIKPKTYKYNDSPDDRTHWGFVAQDVAAVMHEKGFDFGGHFPVDEMHPQEGLAYHELTAVLWRAVQELAAKLEARDG